MLSNVTRGSKNKTYLMARTNAMAEQKKENSFRSTLNLPKTDFSIRANANQKEPDILQHWENQNIFERASDKNRTKSTFILHDGPPYANGHLHLGHALTYILKDIVCKSKRMLGYHAPLVPGWDCHGLPIELKVTAEHDIENKKDSIDPIVFKKYCRDYAKRWIEIQKKELKELGKFADYEHAYRTMDPAYESKILEAFASFVEGGYIEHKGKTVPWCASCQTVLASAEIEYNERKDPSIYVCFTLDSDVAREVFPIVFEKDPAINVSLLVWTTTPWTIPLNRAVVLNPETEYALIQSKEEGQAIVVARNLADSVCAALGIEKVELACADAQVFQGKKVLHPLHDDFYVPVLLDDSVLTSEGTAVLHTAPGCGPEDYQLGLKYGLEIYSPLDGAGRYTNEIKPAALEGMTVPDGQIWVLKTLTERGKLAHKGSIRHSYPHCWRCHNGLIFRATKQWFCDLKKNSLTRRALDAIEGVTFVPEWGKNRLYSFVENRSEWCISRQRQWGVPIPALLCEKCEAPFLEADFVRRVAARVAKNGIEYWDSITPDKMVSEGLLDQSFACPSCANADLTTFKQEKDILDVWFDSGVSSYAVLAQKNNQGLGIPADLYFEGSDQHRGWFQSALLCGVVLYNHAPMRAIATHGFIVDEQKRKMSKSVGNVVAPQDVVDRYSRDILRLWVASSDFSGDIVISEKLLQNVAEMYRKIRNTCRFLLSNLYDFDIAKNATRFENLYALDQYAMVKLYDLSQKVQEAYDEYNYTSVVHLLNNFCTNDLSALYLDIVKDRLYVEHAQSKQRRGAQTVIFHTVDVLTKLMAPILSFLAEEVSDYYQSGKGDSIHLQDFAYIRDIWEDGSNNDPTIPLHTQTQNTFTLSHPIFMRSSWEILEILRDNVLKAIEGKREQGLIKHSLESSVRIFIEPDSHEANMLSYFEKTLADYETLNGLLKDWCIVSQVERPESKEGLEQTGVDWLKVAVEHAQGVKCPRCWKWSTESDQQELCPRCSVIVEAR
ncbi:MAG: isoleucine--tRNA ligase [Epsilonproteobacteria bacterium]|nr:isoleucine--tRNA ligase [Campylobacterota bacterium]